MIDVSRTTPASRERGEAIAQLIAAARSCLAAPAEKIVDGDCPTAVGWRALGADIRLVDRAAENLALALRSAPT